MKFATSVILLAAAIFTTAFTAKHTEDYKVNTDATTIKWTGKKLTGTHWGSVKVKEGMLLVNHGRLVSGKIVMDMTSITVDDIKDKGSNEKLLSHLKNDDFFSVDKHPTATITITRVYPNPEGGHMLSCNFEIKGISNRVEVPAKLSFSGDAMTGTANFKIDRTLWDIRYKSGKIFPDLGDKAISDDVEFEVALTASLN
jgi:polyisoprenoid-binding protein YceI